MAEFLISKRDFKFICKEWLDMGQIFALERFNAWSVDDLDMIIDQLHKVAKEIVAPTREDSDNIQATFKEGKVTVPPSFHKAYWHIQKSGWGATNDYLKTEGALPYSITNIGTEMFFSANPSFPPYYLLCSGAGNLIQNFADQAAQDLFCEKLFSGQWSGTMCLTEPSGGSDAGDFMTKAYPTDDSRIYKIKGSKCFITSGDHDITENIIHLLLARIDGAASGTKGLSLFIVPKIWVNADGSLGASNDVTTVGIERKMGLKGSATAVLNFGENNECRGILIGNPPNEKGIAEGMSQMFQMVNGSRIKTGQMALAVASAAYSYALQYAKERIQGRPFTNPKAGRVPIIQHEDVRRMLMNMKSHNEAMRALCMKMAYLLDMSREAPDPQVRKNASDLLEISTPLLKAYCSDVAWELCAEAIQVFGGYGYSEEYPVAQCARDVKIYSIWEGTNFIQSLDLVGRKFGMEKGQVFDYWMAEIKSGIDKCASSDDFVQEVKVLEEAWNTVQQIYQWCISQLRDKNPALVPLYSTRILHCCSMLICGQLILDQAWIAQQRLKEIGPDHFDYAFYKGKVLTARYYIHNVVPKITYLASNIFNADTSAIEMPEEGF
ncbi:MAG: acyl-CoA dehydrogenase [Syntrophomonadaceae bacterium]|nr:acyl-CoA dehydrogenase [Syntrophomonadaceae bacterium]